MNRTLLAAAAFGALAIAAPAFAQPSSVVAGWQVDVRQAQLDQRIDMGIRNGTLTRTEATRLRGEFRTIANLEARYRVGGLQQWERADLDRRFDQLSAQIRVERADNQGRGPGYNNGRGPGYNNGRGPGDRANGGASIDQRQAMLDRRIDMGVRNGSLNRSEATRLRAEFRAIANLEARYRVGGLNMTERADLDRRFDILQARIRNDLADNNFRWDNQRYR